MRVAVYASARDEEKNLPDWLDSTAGADVVVVNDTGSTDNTYELLCEAVMDGKLHSATQLPVVPMQLSNALNIAMSQLPDDIDLAIRLDLDERLQPGWRDAIEVAWDKRTTTKPLLIPVWFDHGGEPYLHTRVHSREGFGWVFPVHEVLTFAGLPVPARDDVSYVERIPADMTIEHHQDLTKDRSQVLQELIDAHDADPTNPRWLHYLGREYTYRADWQHAFPLLRQHVESFDFAEQCSESWLLLGDGYKVRGDTERQLVAVRSAAAVAPTRREGWVKLAELCMEQERWPESLQAAETALAITERNWYLNWPYAWGGMPWHLAALAASRLGKSDIAVEYGRRAVELEPDNDLYRSNLVFYEGAMSSV